MPLPAAARPDWLLDRILGYRTLPKTQLDFPILFRAQGLPNHRVQPRACGIVYWKL